MIAYTVPLFLRGRVITDNLVPFDTRLGAAQFQAPDMRKYVERLPLKSPAEMSDLYEVSFDEILDVLAALGDALDFESNNHLQYAYEASMVANVLPPEMLQNSYRILRPLFSRDNVAEIADSQVGSTISTDGSRTRCATVANCGCARSAPACCTSRRATAGWSPR